MHVMVSTPALLPHREELQSASPLYVASPDGTIAELSLDLTVDSAKVRVFDLFPLVQSPPPSSFASSKRSAGAGAGKTISRRDCAEFSREAWFD